MVVGIKDTLKLIGIAVVVCCAVFVCRLFLNYNMDIVTIKDQITTEMGVIMYEAILSTGKVVCLVTGGCLVITSLILLIFYITNYINSHKKQLGILKAMGYSNIGIAKHFWVFGISVFAGSILGCLGARIYLPAFYELQNGEGLFPEITVQFHAALVCYLIAVPTLLFVFMSVFYGWLKLRNPTLELLREKQDYKIRNHKEEAKHMPFLKDLKKSTLRDKKILVFFIIFSGFCFSAMTQMSVSMGELSSKAMGFMILAIGLILACMTLFLSLTTVVKANTKTIAMMQIVGYQHHECSKVILNGYRPFSYIGFAIGTIYQYILLKIIVTVLFADVEHVPEYSFDFGAFVISLVVFIVVYELVMYCYSLRIKQLSIKSIMLE